MRVPRLAVLVGILVAVAASAAPAAPFAYVTNLGSGSVSVVDVATEAVVGGPITVPGMPFGVVVNADASRVYVGTWSPHAVSVIDTASRTVVAHIPLPVSFPAGLALTPDGSRLFVAHMTTSGPTLTVIQTATNAVVAALAAGRFNGGVVVHPNGRKVYIGGQDGVVVYDAATLAHLSTITTWNRAFGLAMDPAGAALYVANYSANSVTVVDPSSDTIRAEVFTGSGPYALALSPDGRRLFVANQFSGTLSIVDTATLAELHEVPLGGAMPYGVQSGPDGSRVYVADNSGNAVVVVDALAGVVVKRIPVGAQPIAFGEFLRGGAVPTTLASGGVTPAEILFRSSAPVSLRVVLTQSGGAAVAGAPVEFLLDGAVVGAAVTGSDGAAVVAIVPSALDAGLHTAAARFAGGPVGGVTYAASSAGLGTLRVLYRFDGFLPPLRAGINDRGAGAMVIARWRLLDAAGAPVNDYRAVAGVATATMPCGTAPVSWTEALASLSLDPAGGIFEYRWKTEKAMAGRCARLRVTLADGTAHSVDVRLR